MIDNFQRCLAFTLAPAQDGQPLHVTPGDPGGATDEGITLPALAGFLNKRIVTIADLESVANDPVQRSAFYAVGYWQAVSGNSLPRGVDLMVFDFGVTDGPRTSAKLLQQALGFVGGDVDGWIGPQSIAAATARIPSALILALALQQYGHISGLDPRFRNGWRNRVARAEGQARAWLGINTAPTVADDPDNSADALNAAEQTKIDGAGL